MGREQLSRNEALRLLPEQYRIHTFVQADMGALLGADMSRERIIDWIERNGAEIGGPNVQAIKHALVVWDEDREPIFVETKQGQEFFDEFGYEYESEREIKTMECSRCWKTAIYRDNGGFCGDCKEEYEKEIAWADRQGGE